MPNELLPLEAHRLSELEQTIEAGLRTFVDVGRALLEIRDGRLYRQEYGTFEDYCRERWGFEKSQTYRLMDSAKVIANLETSPIGEVLPANEAQARPLVQLKSEQQPEAWQHAIETAPDGKITGAHVQRVVDEFKKKHNYDGLVEQLEELQQKEQERTAINNPVLYSSDSDEWYTPNHVVYRVLQALGTIDLDPCSNSKENPIVPAVNVFTKDDNGLMQDWFGKVYMNPPYGREIAEWVSYLVEQYEHGKVVEAIALVPSRTDTEWFRVLRDYPRCFVWGRLKFSDNGNAAPFPSMAVYLGRNLEAFREAFSDIGDIYIRV